MTRAIKARGTVLETQTGNLATFLVLHGYQRWHFSSQVKIDANLL